MVKYKIKIKIKLVVTCAKGKHHYHWIHLFQKLLCNQVGVMQSCTTEQGVIQSLESGITQDGTIKLEISLSTIIAVVAELGVTMKLCD